jgi:hypothetical protein
LQVWHPLLLNFFEQHADSAADGLKIKSVHDLMELLGIVRELCRPTVEPNSPSVTENDGDDRGLVNGAGGGEGNQRAGITGSPSVPAVIAPLVKRPSWPTDQRAQRAFSADVAAVPAIAVTSDALPAEQLRFARRPHHSGGRNRSRSAAVLSTACTGTGASGLADEQNAPIVAAAVEAARVFKRAGAEAALASATVSTVITTRCVPLFFILMHATYRRRLLPQSRVRTRMPPPPWPRARWQPYVPAEAPRWQLSWLRCTAPALLTVPIGACLRWARCAPRLLATWCS